MVLYNSMSSLILFCSFFMIISFLPLGTALNFNLTNISPKNLNVDITVEKDAYVSAQGIEVTSDEHNVNRAQKAGRAMYIKPLHLWDKASGKVTDFDTHFLFVIDSEQNVLFGDGITFFLIPPGDSNVTVGAAMGLPINPTTYHRTSPFVAVEFDTFNNHDVDPENLETHVGIDVNSFISNSTAVWENGIYFGSENEAWITYNSNSKNLSVVFTSFKNTTRVLQELHLIVDLRKYLPEWVRIGFSASTGTLFERHNIRSWQFNSSLQIDEKTGSGQDSNMSTHEVNKGGRNIMGMVVGSTVGLVFLLLGW